MGFACASDGERSVAIVLYLIQPLFALGQPLRAEQQHRLYEFRFYRYFVECGARKPHRGFRFPTHRRAPVKMPSLPITLDSTPTVGLL